MIQRMELEAMAAVIAACPVSGCLDDGRSDVAAIMCDFLSRVRVTPDFNPERFARAAGLLEAGMTTPYPHATWLEAFAHSARAQLTNQTQQTEIPAAGSGRMAPQE